MKKDGFDGFDVEKLCFKKDGEELITKVNHKTIWYLIGFWALFGFLGMIA